MKMELLAPAGSPESLMAAVEGGAGAVYLGWGSFHARRGAANFSEEEFAAALACCHARGVRVYLTLNILLTDRELPEALETARTASRLGVDAVLVQDWGLMELLKRMLPDLPLHASTQMSVFTSGGAQEAASDGCERIVIARECSREETAAICRNCPAEIEAFVHGALCMCYSGQCAMSALIGGRSGNRGRCAQPCRMPYGVNGPAKEKRPLSLKDSCLAGELQEMEAIGVACGKIEGRMRRPAYVSAVTEIYARLLKEGRGPSRKERERLEEAYSRSGFTDAYWRGEKGPQMLGFRPENGGGKAAVQGKPEAKEAAVRHEEPGIPVRFYCRVAAEVPALLTAEDDTGRRVTVTGAVPEAARTRSLTEEELVQRLRKTGGTPYVCQAAEAEVSSGLSLPASAVNAMRRRALEALTAARTSRPERRELEEPPLPEDTGARRGPPELTVSLASRSQLSEALLAQPPARVSLPLEEFAEINGLPEGETEWCAVVPRVWRDKDEDLFRELLAQAKKVGVTGALLGNIGHFPLLRGRGLRLYGDYGLNVFNSRSLAYLKEKGLSSACLSYELRFSQLRDMRKPIATEAIVYGRLPLMLTENCLIKNGAGTCRCKQANYLQDRTGAKFPLLPAWGHRTEVENSRALWLADRSDWKEIGLAMGRLRFTTETAKECVRILEAYQGKGKEAPPKEFTRGLYLRGVE